MKYLLFNWNTIDQEISDPSELTDKEFEEIAQKHGLVITSSEDFQSQFNSEHFSTDTHQLRVIDNSDEIVDALSKLRNTVNAMIGHPENPFDEHHLHEMVTLADEQLNSSTIYYALFDGNDTRDYLVTGLNFTDKQAIREDLIDNQENQFDEEEDFETFKKMTLEEMCAHLGYTLDKDTQPF